tara:strand:+ start:323 stop:586 length:264 start_codon:yes stop_codon:yes gene_type:complete
MGTLSVSQAENLIKKGILKEDTVESLQGEGVVSKRKRNTRKFMKTKQGNFVSPQIYFQGVNGDEYSKEMLTLKKQVQTLFDKYTTTK